MNEITFPDEEQIYQMVAEMDRDFNRASVEISVFLKLAEQGMTTKVHVERVKEALKLIGWEE